MTKSTWSDAAILYALDMRDQGHSMAKIGANLGTTKNAIIGILGRVNAAANAVSCSCKKPENRDGGMTQAWWVSGLENRG